MDKKQMKEIENLQKLKENGALTDEEFQEEKKKILNSDKKKNDKCVENFQKTNNKKILIIIGIAILVIIIVTAITLVLKNKSNNNLNSNTSASSNVENDKKTKSDSSNLQAGNIDNISFGNYNSNNPKFNETQKNIIEYFNNNYMQFSSADAQKYPQMFKGAKVCTYVRVVKVLQSTDDEYEFVAADLSTVGWKEYYETVDKIPNGNIICIKGKQLNERLTGGEKIYVYGTYQM